MAKHCAGRLFLPIQCGQDTSIIHQDEGLHPLLAGKPSWFQHFPANGNLSNDFGNASDAPESGPCYLFQRAMRNILRLLKWTQQKTFPVTIMAVLAAVQSGAEEPAQESVDTLTGGWSQRTRLENAGVRPFADLTTEVWGNIDGGLQTGIWWNQLLDFGMELDFAKIGGLEGGRFMMQCHWVGNSQKDRTFSDYTGASNPVSGIMAGDHFRFYNLYYRQAWREDLIVVKIGQLAADDDFMLSDYSTLFANSSFGAMPSQVDRPSFPIWPVAAPGLFLSLRPAKPLYVQTGVYYGQPGPDTDDNLGFDWTRESDPSVAVFYEGGLNYTLCGRSATVRLGGTYHGGDYDDYGAINSGNPDTGDRGSFSFYAGHDCTLISRQDDTPALALFWRGGLKPEPGQCLVTGYTDAGLNWFGPLPGRPADTTGIAVGCTGFGQEFRKSTQPNGVAACEATVEVAYKAQITRWFSLQTDVQLLFNPAVSASSGSRETATVVGLRAHLSF